METKKTPFWQQVNGLPANFWVACLMELLERLAFFGCRAIAPLYLVASSAKNGLDLDFTQKGYIYTVWALIQCILPMVSGGFTDRYGYRKSLAIAFVINILGYIGMAESKPLADYLTAQGWENMNFWVFMVAACFVGTGTAIFKPPAQGTIAKSTNEETASMGWGVFYWAVNIGGALAPMIVALIRGEVDWHLVFYAAGLVTAVNFLPAFFLYREPERAVSDKDQDAGKGIIATFVSSIATIFTDLRLVVFLGIFSCFWLMFMQLWDLLPNFIDEWVDTSDVAPYFAWFSQGWVTETGQTKPELIININPATVILLVIPISALIARMNKVAAMIVGMVISLVAFVASGATGLGVVCVAALFLFSIGEMTCSPTFNAYIGIIAPKEKKALYMGYANIPFAIGWAAGATIGGHLYEAIANKTKLAREYMVNNLGMDAARILDEEALPKDDVMATMASAMNGGAGATVKEATQVLWDLHHPYLVWYYLGGIGLVGTIGMIIFYFATRTEETNTGSE